MKTEKRTPKKNTRTIYFELYAPEAGSVHLAGNFNGWDPAQNPLKKYDKGIWKTGVALPPGRYEYRYKVDDSWQNDPSAAEFAPNAFGTWNCVIEVH